MANKEKIRCARCSGDPEYGKCGEEVRPKCCHCGGNHSVAFWGCKVMRKEVKVQQIKTKEYILMLRLLRELNRKRKIRAEKI